MWCSAGRGRVADRPTVERPSRAAGESRCDQGWCARPGGQFLRFARTPYPDRGASTVRAGAESDEAGGVGGVRASDKSRAWWGAAWDSFVPLMRLMNSDIIGSPASPVSREYPALRTW